MPDFQTRIETKHDNIRRKIIDNMLGIQGHLTDTIRFKVTKNREGDVMQRLIEEADIIPISFPPMKDVPIIDLKKEDGQYTLTSLVSAVGALEQEVPQYYIINAPRYARLETGDIIFRVFIEPGAEYPNVLGLQLTEKLGTIGANALILVSYKCAIYTENLNEKIVQVIGEMAKRRLHIKY
jgi:hypothetical protein